MLGANRGDFVTDLLDKKAVLVKIIYYEKLEGSLKDVEVIRKAVKVLPNIVGYSSFEPVVKHVLNTEKDLVMRRKSRRHRQFVPLEKQEDYQNLRRSLKVKSYICLVVIDKALLRNATAESFCERAEFLLKVDSKVVSVDDSNVESKPVDKTNKQIGTELLVDKMNKQIGTELPVDKMNKQIGTELPNNKMNKQIGTELPNNKMNQQIDENKSINNQVDNEKTSMQMLRLFSDLMSLEITMKNGLDWRIEEMKKTSEIGPMGERVIHRNVYCSNCGIFGIPGVRYKCLSCDDFNLCGKCEVKSPVSGFHDKSHILAKIVNPQNQQTPAPVSRKAIAALFGLDSNTNSKRRHEGIYCNGCHAVAFEGVRYKCMVCYDYDLCDKCKLQGKETSSHTNNHTMMQIGHNSDNFALWKAEPKPDTPLYSSIFCDSCKTKPSYAGEKIKGLRYKCLECCNFDLCETCYMNKAQVFNHSYHHKVDVRVPAIYAESYSPFVAAVAAAAAARNSKSLADNQICGRCFHCFSRNELHFKSKLRPLFYLCSSCMSESPEYPMEAVVAGIVNEQNTCEKELKPETVEKAEYFDRLAKLVGVENEFPEIVFEKLSFKLNGGNEIAKKDVDLPDNGQDVKSLDEIKPINEDVSFNTSKPINEDVFFDNSKSINEDVSFNTSKPINEDVSFDNSKPINEHASFDNSKPANEDVSFNTSKPNSEHTSFDNALSDADEDPVSAAPSSSLSSVVILPTLLKESSILSKSRHASDNKETLSFSSKENFSNDSDLENNENEESVFVNAAEEPDHDIFSSSYDSDDDRANSFGGDDIALDYDLLDSDSDY